jgi:hypothetical protein
LHTKLLQAEEIGVCVLHLESNGVRFAQAFPMF